MNVEDGAVKGCSRCARLRSSISINQADVAGIARKLSGKRTDLSRAALTGALPKAKLEVAEYRAILTDHLEREH